MNEERDILDENLRLREFLEHFLENARSYPRGTPQLLFNEAEDIEEYLKRNPNQ